MVVPGNRRLVLLLLALPVFTWGLAAGHYVDTLYENPLLFWVHDILEWVALPAIVLTCAALVFGITPSHYGLALDRSQDVARHVVFKVIVSVCAFLSFVPVQEIFALMLRVGQSVIPYHDLVPKGPGGIPIIMYLAVTAAIVEEIFFRGILKEILVTSGSISQRCSFVLISASLFGISHWHHGLFKIAATTYLGIVSAILYLRWRNLWYLIAGHFALNLIVGYR